jgi:hypothetical protein
MQWYDEDVIEELKRLNAHNESHDKKQQLLYEAIEKAGVNNSDTEPEYLVSIFESSV